MASEPYSLESLREAETTFRRCEQGRIALPEVKQRTPARDAPYQQHRLDSWVGFDKTRTLPIPPDVFTGIKSTSPTATQSLFPSIRRACITVDNKVYLWSYLEGQAAFEFYCVPEDQVVIAASVAPVRSGVFADIVTHVLVLSVGVSVREGKYVKVLGLSYTENGSSSKVEVLEAGMTANTNGVILDNLTGTNGGRVFATGSDNCLYELVYQRHEGWFTDKCYLRNITSPRLSNLLPTFVKADKKLLYITVDNTRQLVYTLRQGDLIEVYSLPSKDPSSAPERRGQTIGTSGQQGTPHARHDVGSIVWIGPVEKEARFNVLLLAVTDRGYRIFLDNFQGRSEPAITVRAPPALQQPPGAASASTTAYSQQQQVALQSQQQSQQQQIVQQQTITRAVSSVLYAGDVFMLGFNYNSLPCQICCITPALNANANTSGPVEKATFIDLELALSTPVFAEAPASRTLTPITDNGELARATYAQNLRPPRSFLVLDNNGLTELVERRPVDTLRGLLESGAAVNSAAMMQYFGLFGSIEACESALAIAAHNSQVAAPRVTVGLSGGVPAGLAQTVSEEVVALASRVFFSQYGSWPADTTVSAALSAPRTSRHDGLALYIACILKRVWDRAIMPPEPAKPGVKPAHVPSNALKTYRPAGSVATASALAAKPLRKEDLEETLQDLVPLHEFMQQSGKLFGLGGSSAANRSFVSPVGYDQERAAKLDQESFGRLQALVSRAMEATNFMLFLTDHGLKPLIDACSPEAKDVIANLRFGQLITSDQGKRASKELVTALIEARIGAQVSIDAVADALQARCGSFCSADDVRQYKATECIRRAKETRSEQDKMDNLRMSHKLLVKGASQISVDKLRGIVQDYRSLGYATGAIELALQCAREWDPTGMAASFVAEGSPDGVEHRARREVAERLKEAFKLVFETLEELDQKLDEAYNLEGDEVAVRLAVSTRDKARTEAYARAEVSDDVLFQESLYAWLIERKMTDQLLSMRTLFLEPFLARRPTGAKGADVSFMRTLRNLLWQYYVRHGECFAAAQVLDALAHSKEFELDLRERIEYLALAVGNAKSVSPSHVEANEVVTFLSQAEDSLEVAQIQARVLQSLQQLSADDLDSERSALLADSIEWLNEELLDLSTLFKNLAEPFGLLEEQLAMIASAELNDVGLISEIWVALMSKQHAKGRKDEAFKSISALVVDLFTRLDRSEVACPVDNVLDLLLRYGFEQTRQGDGGVREDSIPIGFARKSDGDNGAAKVNIPEGWASQTMLRATGAPEVILDILESAMATSPQPWNTAAGQAYLQAELVEFASTWIELSTTSSAVLGRGQSFARDVGTLTPVQVQRLFALLNSVILNASHQTTSVTNSARKAIDLLKLYY
ncbi:related to NUP170 - nuclear pore protein [Melanopsichium pennsylvanicum]|uniref:Related to NUP170 - nuclear pore protein n=2 Tax=Melanopsichium pennsylvanicum TaxID=63383 RepID=A0AAJ5C624_9BASI|nr:related to NUP170-nuclear pore protein [Melanopsichium pennsylvanicum 4]SNX85138.1 related to NUP170 - nuclear pore protein [Melanopsichium pennsylvanicum]